MKSIGKPIIRANTVLCQHNVMKMHCPIDRLKGTQ